MGLAVVEPPEELLLDDEPLDDELPLEPLLLEEELLPLEELLLLLEEPEFANAEVLIFAVVEPVVAAPVVAAALASDPDVPPHPVSAIVAALLINTVQARPFAPIPRLAFPI